MSILVLKPQLSNSYLILLSFILKMIFQKNTVCSVKAQNKIENFISKTPIF